MRKSTKHAPIKAAAANTGSIIAMTGAVTIKGAEGDAAKQGPRRFDVTAYTGGKLVVAGYDRPVVVDLAGMTKANSLVANLDHKQSKRVGNVTDFGNDGKSLQLGGMASAATKSRTEVVASADDGFVWQASIEAVPTKLIKVGAKETVELNGQTFAGPLYVAATSVLKGFAFVSHGADDNTSVKIAATAASPSKEKDMTAECKQWIEAMGLVVADLSEDQIEKLEANYAGQKTPTKSKIKKLDDIFAAEKAEELRREQIADITARAISDNPSRGPDFITKLEVLSTQAIEAKWDSEKYELELLRATRPQAHTVYRTPERDGRLSSKLLEAAVCLAGNLPKPEKHYDEQTLEAAEKRFPTGIGLKQLLVVAAKANGHFTDSNDVTLDVQRAAFGMGRSGHAPIMADGLSTLSLPGILSNIANKFLLEGWLGQDMTWQQICSIRPVKDFKTVSSYRLSGTMKYEMVGPSGELKHGKVGESTYTNKADTYGKMFSISRTDIINDDLGALTGVPRELGMGANDSFNEVFWKMFLNNSSFFTSGNNNVSTGAGSALAIAGLVAGELIFLNQTKPNGQPLGVLPTILLVPPAIKRTALGLMNSQLVVSGNTTAGPDSNTFAGSYEIASTPFLSNSSFTGYSTAAWYLLGAPARGSVIEAAFLNGRTAPVIETADAEFNVLGIQMRGYHDFGVNLQEARYGVRSAGS